MDDDEYYFTVKEVRNVFKPRWWQFRRRYYVWKRTYIRYRMRKRYGPEIIKMLDEMGKEVERKVLFGEEN